MLTTRHRITVSAIAALAAGGGLLAHGVIDDSAARTTGGGFLLSCALLLLVLQAVRTWVTDTSAEQARLAEATRAADAERERYTAGCYTLDGERQRIRRDATRAAARAQAALTAEMERLRAEADAERFDLQIETFQTAYRLIKNGLGEAPPADAGGHQIIPFPTQHPAEPERSRGRP
ncbi:hypothetical protein ACIGW8_22360 [Streptomyces sioyaensis]|uniref:hypothetical protein n=1 Tax=Streptomyces sioyaensis TaxID=67364 RepID=UPI0037D92AB2